MERTRAYRRRVRAKTIRRKKNISETVYHRDYYPFDGKYAKGKIHCSCGMCRIRDHEGRHLFTVSEWRACLKLEEGLLEYCG